MSPECYVGFCQSDNLFGQDGSSLKTQSWGHKSERLTMVNFVKITKALLPHLQHEMARVLFLLYCLFYVVLSGRQNPAVIRARALDTYVLNVQPRIALQLK